MVCDFTGGEGGGPASFCFELPPHALTLVAMSVPTITAATFPLHIASARGIRAAAGSAPEALMLSV